MDDAKVRIGDILKQLREARDMTQEDLAGLIGKTAGAIGQLERGMIYPNYDTLAKIIDAFDVDANLFFFKDASSQPDLSRWITDLFYGMTDGERESIGLFFKKFSSIMLRQPDEST
jgi:transcriptional regulator with XRE-family HTH domain